MTPHAARFMNGLTATARRPGFLATTLAPLRAILAACVRELRTRRDQRILAEMGDYELADIGISRSQITDAVRYGRVSPWISQD
jgi:uncharacterized protein YjiS (DUF1127 family)